jgi:hypothetical protein
MVKLSNRQLSTIKANIVHANSRKYRPYNWPYNWPVAPGKGLQLIVRVLLLAILNFGLAGCIKVDTGTRAPTMGAELIDLVRAKESGTISDQEFKTMRRKVLASF